MNFGISLQSMLRGSALRLHIGGAVLLSLLVFVFQGEGVWQSHRQYQARAELSARNLGGVLAGSIAGTFRSINLTLLSALDWRHQAEVSGGIDARRFNETLSDMVARVPGLLALRLTDQAGNVVLGTGPGQLGINVADRDFFRQLKDGGDDVMVISEPVLGRIVRDWILICARRFNLPDGRFGGVLYGTVAINGIAERLTGQKINLSDQDSLAIIDKNMNIVARYVHNIQDISMTGKKAGPPSIDKLFYNTVDNTLEISRSTVDNIERIFYTQRVPEQPLAVIIGLASDTAYAGWWRETITALINCLIFVLLVLYGSYLIYQAQKRQDRTLGELDDALRFNQTVIDNSEIGIHVYRQDGQCVLANEALAQIVGSSQDIVSRQNFRDLQSWKNCGARELAEKALEGGMICRHQASIVTQYGKAMWMQWVFTPFNYRGARHLLVMSRDITDIHLAQMSLESSNRQLTQLSKTDGLTGINNRRSFDEAMDSEWRRAGRSQQPIALMLIDVDHFKLYNDHYGHQMGDDCLRSIADTLTRHCARAGDLVARYGGEEFAFIAAATEGANAEILAEAIRVDIENRAIAHDGAPFGRVTVSIGVAAITPVLGLMPEMLIKSADKALYQAKDMGRNTVVLALSHRPLGATVD